MGKFSKEREKIGTEDVDSALFETPLEPETAEIEAAAPEPVLAEPEPPAQVPVPEAAPLPTPASEPEPAAAPEPVAASEPEPPAREKPPIAESRPRGAVCGKCGNGSIGIAGGMKRCNQCGHSW